MGRANKQSFAPLRRRASDEFVRISMQRDRLGDGNAGGGPPPFTHDCAHGAFAFNLACQTAHANAAGFG